MDPRTPVVVGVGQVVDPLGTAEYAALSTVDLAAAAGGAAIEDAAGVPVSISEWIDAIVCPRPMEISGPGRALLGAPSNFPRAVARKMGLVPARAVLEVIGGQAPQRLINECAAEIAAGRHTGVLLTGGDSTSTHQYFAAREDRPDFSDPATGQLEDRGEGWEYYLDDNLLAHSLFIAPAAYGLVDNARRARLGLGVEAYRAEMGRLFAPFSEIAAVNRISAAPFEWTASELAEVTAENPMIWDPYPKRVIAREKVNMGAAVLLMSVDAARRCGIPEEKWVYLRGHADLVDLPFLERPDLSRGPASVAAVKEALRVSGTGLDDVATFDFYSCFAAPVFNICDNLGLRVDDPRGLTVTGGLPFFGGPGANYSTHAVAETVRLARRLPGEFGLVGANGGILSKYSAGAYSTEPASWQADRSSGLQTALDAAPRVPVVRHADGGATVETFTCSYGRSETGIVVARLDSGGRCCALVDEDDTLLDLLRSGDGERARIKVRSDGAQNRAVLS